MNVEENNETPSATVRDYTFLSVGLVAGYFLARLTSRKININVELYRGGSR